MSQPSAALLDSLRNKLGAKGFVSDDKTLAPRLQDYRRIHQGRSAALLLPSSTAEVSYCVRACAEAGVALVPQGGNTGYTGGCIPAADGSQLLLGLGRMDRVRNVDPLNYSMTVEAGCILANLQQVAETAGRFLPLALGAQGSCQIGGNLSTNAGGMQVLRYGNARDLVLGLEVVLPDGRIWDGLRSLRKDNTGYDLKQLFIGAEGTLGIITAAVLKLFPQARERLTALLVVESPDAALRLLADCREVSGDAVSSAEYFTGNCLRLVVERIPTASNPFDQLHEHYLLLEMTSGREGWLEQALEQALSPALEDGRVLDAIVASNLKQAKGLWTLREAIPPAQRKVGSCIKHDVSVPVSMQPEFLRQASALAAQALPAAELQVFGHLGDGNMHFNLSLDEARAHSEPDIAACIQAVHDLAVKMGGSFSAEHGIGILKREELGRYKGSLELELMRTVKQALDPHNLMNPGKLLPPDPHAGG